MLQIELLLFLIIDSYPPPPLGRGRHFAVWWGVHHWKGHRFCGSGVWTWWESFLLCTSRLNSLFFSEFRNSNFFDLFCSWWYSFFRGVFSSCSSDPSAKRGDFEGFTFVQESVLTADAVAPTNGLPPSCILTINFYCFWFPSVSFFLTLN